MGFGVSSFGSGAFGAGSFGGAGDLISYFKKYGLVFYKDYTYSPATMNADYSIGSATATFTASRSASNPATYIDLGGKLNLVTSSDIPRYAQGYYDATGFSPMSGLLIESGSTNLCYCGAFDSNCAWNGANFQYSGVTRWILSTANGGAATASVSTDSLYIRSMKISITNQGAGATDVYCYPSNGVAITNTNKFTVSFWVKTSVAKTIPLVCCNAGFALNYGLNTTYTTVANKWIRIVKTFTANNTDGNAFVISELGNLGTFDWQFEGFQCEQLPYASSFIPTTAGTRTRNAELLKYVTSNNRTTSQETIVTRVVPQYDAANMGTTVGGITSTDTKDVSGGFYSSSQAFLYPNLTDTVGCVAQGSTILKNTSYVVGMDIFGTAASTKASIFINGSSVGTTTTAYTAPTFGTYFYVGSGQGSSQLNGIVQRVAIFSKSSSSIQMSDISGLL